jgi:YD repeat-containing protein
MSNIEPIYEYDSKGNLIHYRDSDGWEAWYEYDSNGNYIHFRSSVGLEAWREYDTNGKLIHFKNSFGDEYWYDLEVNEYKTQEDAIRANNRINLNNLINQMSFEDLVVLENLIKDRFIQQYSEVSERIREEQ